MEFGAWEVEVVVRKRSFSGMIYEIMWDGWISRLVCELTYRIDPVSEYLDVVNSCHISQFYLRFLSFQGA